MKIIETLGATSRIWQIFIADSTSTTGQGLAGLTSASSGLVAYYHRDTDTTATAISLVTMTVGTYTSSGFKEIDATNMKGWYQLCPTTAMLAAGAKSVAVHLAGATSMAPLPIEVQLTTFDLTSATVTLSAASIQAIWDALTSALTTVGSIGKLLVDNVNAAIGSTATPAQVKAQVVAALSTDIYAEPSSVPAATASLASKIGYLMSKARNKITQTATTQLLRNDGDSGTIATTTVSDDGTTFTKGKDA